MSIRSKVLLALRWSAGMKLLSQIASWAMTLIVIRLLTPADYGLMSIAAIVIAFLTMINEIGIGPALVQRERVDKALFRVAFGIAIISNLLLLGIVWFSTPLVAGFFEEPALIPIIRTLSIQFLLIPFAAIPEALLLRELNLKRKSIVDLVANVAGGATSLVLAITGHGVWSLVWGSLVLMGLRSIGFIIAAPYFVAPKFSFEQSKQLLSFGALITMDRLLWFFYSRADVIIIGKILGTEALGIYSVAMQIASLPLQKVNSILNEVAFPAFSRIQGDPARVRDYLGKASRAVSFLAFPVFIGISSISPAFIAVVLGDQWQEAVIPLATLACIMPLRMISNIITSALQGIGRVGISVGNLIYAAVIIPLAVFIGAQWGLVGVCIAWLIGFPFVTVIEIIRSRPFVLLGLRDFGSIFYRPLLGSLIMWAGVHLAMGANTVFFESMPGLVISILVGAAIYFVFTLIFNRESLRETIALRSLQS